LLGDLDVLSLCGCHAANSTIQVEMRSLA